MIYPARAPGSSKGYADPTSTLRGSHCACAGDQFWKYVSDAIHVGFRIDRAEAHPHSRSCNLRVDPHRFKNVARRQASALAGTAAGTRDAAQIQRHQHRLVVGTRNGNVEHVRCTLRAAAVNLSLIHISEPTRQAEISYAVFCLK